jgi:hypothetical protein
LPRIVPFGNDRDRSFRPEAGSSIDPHRMDAMVPTTSRLTGAHVVRYGLPQGRRRQRVMVVPHFVVMQIEPMRPRRAGTRGRPCCTGGPP